MGSKRYSINDVNAGSVEQKITYRLQQTTREFTTSPTFLLLRSFQKLNQRRTNAEPTPNRHETYFPFDYRTASIKGGILPFLSPPVYIYTD